MLDLMGKRYSKLPSEIMEFGDTLDMVTCITALEYEQWVERKRANNQVPVHMTQAEMQARIDAVNANSGKK